MYSQIRAFAIHLQFIREHICIEYSQRRSSATCVLQIHSEYSMQIRYAHLRIFAVFALTLVTFYPLGKLIVAN